MELFYCAQMNELYWIEKSGLNGITYNHFPVCKYNKYSIGLLVFDSSNWNHLSV